MDMSFKEKSTWISLASTLGIFGYYFISLFGFSDLPEEQVNEAIAGLLLRSIILIVILEIVFHTLLSATNHKAAEMGEDERDKLIALKANNYGYTVLAVGVVICIVRLIGTEMGPEVFESSLSAEIPMLTAHLLMFSFILSEVVRFTSQIVYYRRGY